MKEHIVIAEQLLGRQLLSNEVVHHIDQDGSNNNPTNLEVMDRGLHTKHHKCGSKTPQYSDKALLEHLKALLPISVTIYRKRFKYPSHETYRYRFGSWTNAKKLATDL